MTTRVEAPTHVDLSTSTYRLGEALPPGFVSPIERSARAIAMKAQITHVIHQNIAVQEPTLTDYTFGHFGKIQPELMMLYDMALRVSENQETGWIPLGRAGERFDLLSLSGDLAPLTIIQHDLRGDAALFAFPIYDANWYEGIPFFVPMTVNRIDTQRSQDTGEMLNWRYSLDSETAIPTASHISRTTHVVSTPLISLTVDEGMRRGRSGAQKGELF